MKVSQNKYKRQILEFKKFHGAILFQENVIKILNRTTCRIGPRKL